MLLKKADDKSKRIALLEDLQKSSMLDAGQKKWLRTELRNLRKGIEGERDSAYYLDQHFKNGENHVLLHDLRLRLDGDTAQIDHLIINRLGMFYLVETKNYAGNVSINPHGEFSVDYGDGDVFGVPSPIEQSRRHERILRGLLGRLEITNRLGTEMEIHHVVMFHPKAIIQRPPQKDFDTSNVIKADQFPSWHAKFVEKSLGMGTVFKGLANIRSVDTAREWGEKLARQHRSEDQLALPEFLKPKKAASASAVPVVKKRPTDQVKPQEVDEPERRLICLHCKSKISFAEGRYCWNNEARFKGGQYCRDHQALF